MPHGSTPDLSAPLPFGSDSPLNWDAPSPRVDAFQSFDPSFDYDAGDASGEEVFSPGWDQMGREAEDIRFRKHYKAVLAPREAATASTGNTHGPIFFPVQVYKKRKKREQRNSRGITLPIIFEDLFNYVAYEAPVTARGLGHHAAFQHQTPQINSLKIRDTFTRIVGLTGLYIEFESAPVFAV